MKKYFLLSMMLLIVAGLIAGVSVAYPADRSTGPEVRHTREVFYTENFETGAAGWTHWDGAVSPNQWHVYNNGDAQGNVWWMGDPALATGGNIGGYHDHQYLVLDTPASAITAGNSTLTFKMRMNMEEPGASGGYNGWDSFNLRISTNSGISYSVIPTGLITPAYDFTDSYAFGSEHGEGMGIPGWGGIHEPWQTVTVDLSTYVGSSVKIRFAFASDPAYSTVDDPTMYGVMVDDIAFGTYTNNGLDDGTMDYSSVVPTAGDFWHLATDASAPSPTHIMSSKNSENSYVNFMLNYLESPSITLPAAATQIVADFQLRGSFFDPGVFPDVDYFGWEISPDNGTTWRYMSNVTADPDGMNYVYSSAPDNWASMITSYTLDGDITIFSGNTVKFRWYFQSNGTAPQGTPLEIDDFQIFSVTAAPAPPNLVYPLNNQQNMPTAGFNLDWSPSALGAFPESYTVCLDASLENLEEATFNPSYTLEITPVMVDDQMVLYSYCHTSDVPGLMLAAGQTWYWMVVASIAGQDDAFSEIYRFDVGTLVVINTFPWEEGFEAATFPPENWMVYNVDGGGTTWTQNLNASYIHSGAASAKHAYSAATPDQDGWFITPAVSLPISGTYRLSWWNYNNYPTYMFYNGVKVNTVADPAATGWLQLWSQDAPASAWSNSVIDISSYNGQIVYFAFVYQGYDADDWYIDDVSIFELTVDEIPPTITHLPLLNTPREDINYTVVADVTDDPTWNSPVGGASIYYSIDAGATWSAPIPMTLARDGYTGAIPAQPLGTDVSYYIEGWDSLNNTAQSSVFNFSVADPVWIWYDQGGTGYTGFPTYNWGPAVYYENPFYGTGTPMQLLATDGALYNNNAGNPATPANLHVYGEELDGTMYDLITPIPVSFNHTTYTVFDLSTYNIQVTTPWFWISYEDFPLGCYFLLDGTYNYTTLYLVIGGDIYYSTNPGEWCIGAYVQTGVLAPTAPEVTIGLVGGNPGLSWPAVPGAASYNIYGAMDPYAADPWTLLGNTTGLSFEDTSTSGMEFYKVTTDTTVPTRETIVGTPINKQNARPLMLKSATIAK